MIVIYILLSAYVVFKLVLFIYDIIKNIKKGFNKISKEYSDSERYKSLANGFIVTRKEKKEAESVSNYIICGNEYCKNKILALYVTIYRRFPSEVKQNRKLITTLCEYAIAKEIDYHTEIYGDATIYRNSLDNDILHQAIEEEAGNVVHKRGEQKDNYFYDYSLDEWKIKYYHLEKYFQSKKVKQFYEAVRSLADNQASVTRARKILIDAHRFLIDKDREYALLTYLDYLDQKHEGSFKSHNKISARNRKILFKDKETEKAFDEICRKILSDNDYKDHLTDFYALNISQRKKIKLNTKSIKQVAEKQSKVAGVLGRLLEDEEEQLPEKPVVNETIVPTKPAANPNELLLQLFKNQSFKVGKEEVNIFAQSHGFFASQLIERINEQYYEQLDDVLIEEEEEDYSMNETYFQQINGD